MRSKSNIILDIKVGIITFLASVIYLFLSFTIDVSNNSLTGSRSTITPDLMPKVIAVVALISSLFILVPNIINLKSSNNEQVDNSTRTFKSILTKDRIVFLISFAVYLIIMNFIGYIISTIIFSFAILMYLGKTTLKTNMLFSVLLPVIIYLLFNNLLQIWLPVGTLWK